MTESLGHAVWVAGPGASAAVREWSTRHPPGLWLALEGGGVLIPTPLEDQLRGPFAGFLWELADAALVLASVLDPHGLAAPPEVQDEGVPSGRHALLRRDEFGDPDGGVLR
nr:hypothetical protein [Kibdelosporangium sp. MJ126-NF4]